MGTQRNALGGVLEICWKEALEAGVAPPVVLASSHEAAVRYVSIEVLNHHAIDGQNRIRRPEPDK